MDEASSPTHVKPELRMSRVFNAPLNLVWEAWTKAEHLSKWFAPRPLTIPRCELDFRPGGVFRLMMRMPNGVEHPMEAAFREVVEHERIVFAGDIGGDVQMVTTLTFTEADGKTTLHVHQTYSKESDATRGAHQGWTATLDQLGEHVVGRRM